MTPRENTTTERSAAMGKTRVRTTIEPGRVIEVDDAELTDLDRYGVIKSREGDKGWKPEEAEAPAKADDKKES